MGDVKCPRCGGEIEIQGSDVTMYPQCVGECGWSPVVLGSDLGWPDNEDTLRADVLASVRELAHWEPRDRLPTPEEEAAHTARHGAEAGWMGRCYVSGMWRNWNAGWGAGPDHLHPVESYPHVNGRPVGWPEVSRG